MRKKLMIKTKTLFPVIEPECPTLAQGDHRLATTALFGQKRGLNLSQCDPKADLVLFPKKQCNRTALFENVNTSPVLSRDALLSAM